MKIKLFSVYDSKVKCYHKPIYQRNSAEAIRGFEEECNDPKSYINKFPADFTLMEIGEYDDDSGILTALSIHVNLGNGLQYIKVQPTNSLTNISQ